jgi:2,3,4,5-tetrahydropyridine-2-carboxylate N-succinyltransferase
MSIELQTAIENIWAATNADADQAKQIVNKVLSLIEQGKLRVCERLDDSWQLNEWVKKAILLSFKFNPSQVMMGAGCAYFDKVFLKTHSWQEHDFIKAGFRLVPGAWVRHATYVGKGVIVMPSFINIGAYVGDGTMIDSGVTVGSCAQIGENCHISSNVIIGGVLEPLQSNPVIIEDNVFIGAGSNIVEGVRVGRGAVLSMGVNLSTSTRIYDRETKQITYGYVPEYSVVVPGVLPSSDDQTQLYAAIIVKKVDAQTRSKTSLNELLRY